ncbi:hypothetical protein [Calothrix sp. PCC 6303]|uniref:hypothetical protein n=1 Tax=Calothrix sp. PCC 6303 TaxID=1170562 RepID=UPI0002A04BDF|nr:hypothetical protein [Calothrix sp. PCC 6303]AFZ01711.1 hypothetical protein Cal6303_2740 [Calothrix sp. PCC 6303]
MRSLYSKAWLSSAIASQKTSYQHNAIANDLVLMTNNHRDVEKIEDLEIEDWSQT